MILRSVTALVMMLVIAGAAQAVDQELVLRLKQLGNAVDDVVMNIANAESDADAQLLANVTQQTFASGLAGDRPAIVIDARQGYCKLEITTPAWRLWSEARDGQVVDHGAKIH
jgi:hypothetical protein